MGNYKYNKNNFLEDLGEGFVSLNHIILPAWKLERSILLLNKFEKTLKDAVEEVIEENVSPSKLTDMNPAEFQEVISQIGINYNLKECEKLLNDSNFNAVYIRPKISVKNNARIIQRIMIYLKS